MAMRFNATQMVLALLLTGLAGCAPVDPGMGEALRYDMAIQTVNPDPVYPEGGAQPGDNGEKGAKAVKAYRSGATKPLQVQSAGGSAGGAGGGTGGGSTPGS